MYGVESYVHPDYQGLGIGSKLMNARFDLARRENVRGLIAGSMFIGYAKAHEDEHITPEQYVQDVIAGVRFDPNLSKQLHKGFRFINLIPEYSYDPRTHNYAAAILWENPDYQPASDVQRTAKIISGRFEVARGGGVPRSAAGL